MLGAGSHDGTIRLWDLADFSAPREIPISMNHEAPGDFGGFQPRRLYPGFRLC